MHTHNFCSAREHGSFDYVFIENCWVHQRKLRCVPYRWENEGTDNEYFQIFYKNKWRYAQSIDFNF